MTEIMTQIGIEGMTEAFGIFMAFIGICAFLTSLITEAVKCIDKINRLPTKLVCYIVSLLITPLMCCVVMSWFGHQAKWTMILAAFLVSFVAAKVSMNGWDDVTELAQRLIRK